MVHPPVVIVNSNDKVVDWAPLRQAWEQGLVHRLVYVIVEGRGGRILLHRRASGMRLYPGCWDTVAGHVDVTPDYEESAKIELREEAGILDAVLEQVDYFYSENPYRDGVVPKRFIMIFKTRVDNHLNKVDSDEVAESRWFTKEEIRSIPNQDMAFGLELCLPYILSSPAPTQQQADSLAAAAL